MSDRTVRFDISVESAAAVAGVQQFKMALQQVGVTADSSAKQSISAFGRVETMLKKMQSAVVGFIGAFAFAAAIRGIYGIIQAGIEFEASFANVRKTVEGTAIQFDSLSRSMKQLAVDIPIGVEQLNAIAAIGGQQGIEVSGILEFTKIVGKLGIAIDGISVEDAAEQLAMLSNVMDEPTSRLKTISNALVRLGNDFVGNEAQILKFSSNIAGAASRTTITTEQLMALSTALIGTGLKSEKAGTAMSRIITDMGMAVDDGGKKLALFAKTADMSTEAFKHMFKTDTIQALQRWTNGVHTSAEAGANLAAILNEVGFSEMRVRDVATKLQATGDVLAKTLGAIGDEATRAGGALDTEFGKKMDTTRARLDSVWARVNNVAISLSDKLTPTLVRTAEGFAMVTEAARDYSDAIVVLIAGVGTFAGLMLVGKLISATAAFVLGTKAVFAYQAVLGGAATATEALTFATAGLAASVALVAAPIAAAVAAIYLLVDADNALEKSLVKENEAQGAMMTTIRKRVVELGKLGVVVSAVDVKEQGWIGALQAAEKQLKLNRDAEQSAVTIIEARTKAEIELQEAFEKRVASMRSDIRGVDNAKELEAAIQAELRAGTSLNIVVARVGQQADEIAKNLRGLHMSVSAGIMKVSAAFEQEGLKKGLNEFAESQRDATNVISQENMRMIASAQNREIELTKLYESGAMSFDGMQKEYGKSLIELQKKFENLGLTFPKFMGMLAQSEEMQQMHSKLFIDSIIADYSDLFKILEKGQIALPTPDFGHPNTKASVQQTVPTGRTEKEQEEFDKLSKGLLRSMDSLFTTLVKKGKLAWKDIANFASEVFEQMAAGLFKPFNDKMLAPLAEQLGQLGTKISGKITDTISNSGLGDKLGKHLGGAIGGVASAGIGMAIGVGIQAIAGLLKKSGSEVNNNLVQDIQNPFSDAVGKLHDSFMETSKAGKLTLEAAVAARVEMTALLEDFKTDAAAYAATGAKQSTAVKNMFSTISQYWGEDLAVIFEKMDTVITDLGGTIGMTTEDFAKLQEELTVLDDFNTRVDDLIDNFRVNTDDVQALSIALRQLEQSGVSAVTIAANLGNNISSLAAQLRTADMPLPDIISHYDSLIRAQEQFISKQAEQAQALRDSATQFKALTTEIGQVESSIKNALISKLDLLDGQIEKSQSTILNWREDIVDINATIAESRATLQDATYWQEKHNAAIKEAEDALKAAADKRVSTEEQIADLTIKVEEDRLNAIIKSSNNATVVRAAEAQLAKLAMKDTEDHVSQLRRLAEELPELIRLEIEAAAALEQRKLQAELTIEAEKDAIAKSITVKEAERAALEKNIATELEHITVLDMARDATLAQMELFGAARQNEMDKIEETIETLVRRKDALNDERNALESYIALLNNFPAPAPDMQHRGVDTIISDAGNRPVDPWQFTLPNYLGTADTGRTFSTGGYVRVQPGEEIRTAEQARRRDSGVTIQGMQIHVHTSSSNGKQIASDVIDALAHDGELRRRLDRAVKV